MWYGVHLQITIEKWIALTKSNVLWHSTNMHFILEEKEKELIGNIKLSSVTAENNLVFCSVACDLVWSLRWQASSCLEYKARRCLWFYSLLWSNLFLLVLEAGCSSVWWALGKVSGAASWGGKHCGQWVEMFTAALRWGTGDQYAVWLYLFFHWFSGGLE